MEKKLTLFNKKFNWNLGGGLLKLGTSQEADWKIIFISTVILVTLVIALSVFIFIKIDKGEIFSVKETIRDGEGLDLSLLRDTVSYYENKTLEFEKIKSSKPEGIDPSL